MSKNFETLLGYTSPETAYVVDDYPYSFKLRTKIRYWIETKPPYGQRFVSQTLNPDTGKWNKPKASTYSSLRVMYLDEKGYVQNDGFISGWGKHLLAFGRDYSLDAYQRKIFAILVDRYVAIGLLKQEEITVA